MELKIVKRIKKNDSESYNSETETIHLDKDVLKLDGYNMCLKFKEMIDKAIKAFESSNHMKYEEDYLSEVSHETYYFSNREYDEGEMIVSVITEDGVEMSPTEYTDNLIYEEEAKEYNAEFEEEWNARCNLEDAVMSITNIPIDEVKAMSDEELQKIVDGTLYSDTIIAIPL